MKGSLKRSVVCRRENEWILRMIDRLVLTKKAMGIKTSFSYEVYRYVKIGIGKGLDGVKLDREILKGEK